MQLHELKLDSTRQYMVSCTGKRYPIKKQRGRYYIQHAHGQLTVTPVMKEAIPFDGSMADYVFNGHFLEHEYDEYKSFVENELASIKVKQKKEAKCCSIESACRLFVSRFRPNQSQHL